MGIYIIIYRFLITSFISLYIFILDLKQIEDRINDNTYSKLSEFIGDMTKIFDNCRYYNSKESKFYKCAETLESYFVQKIKDFRASVVKPQND